MQNGIPGLPEGKDLILFDGYCNLCNRAVRFVIKRDPKEHFRYSSLTWEPARDLLERFPGVQDVDSILLFRKGKIFYGSTAALKIAVRLSGLWPVLGILLIVPKFLRDPIYDFVARNRYRWFGKSDSCMVPSKKSDHLFLGS